MKEAIGGTWIFVLVITFLALFTTFVSVTTNYSRCYKIKDEILLTIERNHGVNVDSISAINEYLGSLGYTATGSCPNDGGCWYGFSKNSNNGPVNSYASGPNYCISKHVITEKTRGDGYTYTSGPIGHPESAYYQAIVFFKLEWPIINTFFNIKISGETSIIFMLNDIDQIKSGTC